MAKSQLKQLKESLRQHGVLGPQKSKKQRKEGSKDATKRLQRNAALEGIRERFNPFEAKVPARKVKFETASGKPVKKAIERPGVTRGLGEERRRETLLREMQSRNKVGGMMDRRFGENDPSMSLEEKAAERFARQNMRIAKKNSMFNLEDDSEEEMVLTHGGMSLDFGANEKDDFAEDMGGSDGEDFDTQDDRPRKRVRLDGEEDNDDENEGAEDMPERRKTKNEVMKEIIAKSKMYKAERQAAKADDEDLRAELDKGMNEFYEALRSHKPPAQQQLPSPPVTEVESSMDPSRAAMLAGKTREAAEKDYEANLRQLKLEARSKPTVRTKTEEEKAAEQAAKLEELERKRIRRMKGEADSSDEEEGNGEGVEDLDEEIDDAEVFGLAQPQYTPRPQLEVEDEDEFVLDDIIASDSDADTAESNSDSEGEVDIEDDGDDDFINGLVLPKMDNIYLPTTEKPSKSLAYTFPCPQTHDEFLELTKNMKISDLPTVVQRIRALYHKGLAEDNKEKLGKFAAVLLEHIMYIGNMEVRDLPYSVFDSLIRHLHSMAKTQPESIGLAFRDQLRKAADERPLGLLPGDLIMLSAISTIFPTSDHFHPVVTPAMLTIARYLGQSSAYKEQDLSRGLFCVTLALQYQKLAKRYVPEVMSYLCYGLESLYPFNPVETLKPCGPIASSARHLQPSLRLSEQSPKLLRPLSFNDVKPNTEDTSGYTILNTIFVLTAQAAKLWEAKTSFPEIFTPITKTISSLLSDSVSKNILAKSLLKSGQDTLATLTTLTASSLATRKPLLLHNHRPLAIKSSIPAFIENFNPDRHYDPDRERAEMAKLKAEHKKERKGAMRELRKDANFVAREQLREKKAKDEAYDKKFKRLVAEIQSEEGRESKDYERAKAKRKGKF